MSGLFDGEGSITIDIRPGSNVLIISATISQKYKPLLEIVASFLGRNGIHCRVSGNVRFVNELSVDRIEDLRKFLGSMNLKLKRRQAVATLEYLEGKISGNLLLQVFDDEHKAGKRRSTPVRPGRDFTLTYLESKKYAQAVRVGAARVGGNKAKLTRLKARLAALPAEFDVRHLTQVLQCSSTNARYLIHAMQENGLVSCRLTATGKGHMKLVCVKVAG